MRSKRHIELQNMTARWIRNHSFKMCGLPEINAVGYIADFVAIAGMLDVEHTRYTRHSGLTKRYMNPQFSAKKYEKYMNLESMKYKTFGDIDRWYVCIFEVKVSRADFLNTFGNKNTPHAKARMNPVGTAHWVVAEKGICEPKELPEFWGLLIPYGAGLTEKKRPKLNILPDSEIHAIAFDMLWLQMNYRRSYYDQLQSMADTIKKIQRAIIEGEPKEELFRLSNQAIKACCGLADE